MRTVGVVCMALVVMFVAASSQAAMTTSVGFNFSKTASSSTRNITGGASNVVLAQMVSPSDGTTQIDPFAGLYGTRAAGTANYLNVTTLGAVTLGGVTMTTPTTGPGSLQITNPSGGESDYFQMGKGYGIPAPLPLASVDSAWRRSGYGNLFWTTGAMTVTFSGLSGTYDIYVRISMGTGNAGDRTVSIGSQSIVMGIQSQSPTNQIIDNVQTTASNKYGEWMLFTDLTGSTQTLSVSAPSGSEQRTYIGAIQIVPEPATLALLGLGGLGLLFNRKRR